MMLYVLAYLSIECFKIGTSDVRALDVVPLIDDQAKGWRPWLDDWVNDSWMMNCRLLLVVHFSAPKTLLLTLMFQWSFSVFECRLIILSPNYPLCYILPLFLIIFFHKDGDTKIITILREQGKSDAYHSSSLFFPSRMQPKSFIYLFFLFYAFIFA